MSKNLEKLKVLCRGGHPKLERIFIGYDLFGNAGYVCPSDNPSTECSCVHRYNLSSDGRVRRII